MPERGNVMLKQLFCIHTYRSVGVQQLERQGQRETYHRIKCVHCGKVKSVPSDEWLFGKLKRLV